MGQHHALHRGDGVSFALDHNPCSALNRLSRGYRVQRHLVHVGKMGLKRLNVDLRPIGGRIALKQGNDLGDSSKGRLPGFRRAAMRRLHHHHLGVITKGVGIGSAKGQTQGEKGDGKFHLRLLLLVKPYAGDDGSDMIVIISSMTAMLPEPFNRLPPSATVPFRLAQGETLFRSGDASRGCFYLMKGEVRLVRWTREGHETAIHLARAGTTFAEAALFTPHYHCDCVASAESSGLLLPKTEVERLFGIDVGFAQVLAARFARQVQALRRTVEILAIRPARERVMAVLGDYDSAENGGIENLPPLKSIAAQIGLTHEAVYRAVAELVSEGRLERAGHGRLNFPASHRGRKPGED